MGRPSRLGAEACCGLGAVQSGADVASNNADGCLGTLVLITLPRAGDAHSARQGRPERGVFTSAGTVPCEASYTCTVASSIQKTVHMQSRVGVADQAVAPAGRCQCCEWMARVTRRQLVVGSASALCGAFGPDEPAKPPDRREGRGPGAPATNRVASCLPVCPCGKKAGAICPCSTYPGTWYPGMWACTPRVSRVPRVLVYLANSLVGCVPTIDWQAGRQDFCHRDFAVNDSCYARVLPSSYLACNSPCLRFFIAHSAHDHFFLGPAPDPHSSFRSFCPPTQTVECVARLTAASDLFSRPRYITSSLPEASYTSSNPHPPPCCGTRSAERAHRSYAVLDAPLLCQKAPSRPSQLGLRHGKSLRPGPPSP